MKANELMIGDWVQIDEPDKYAGAKGTICSLMHHHSDDGCYFHVFVQDLGVVMREVFNEDLRPIPLTAEILKKNGFKVNKEREMVLKSKDYDIGIDFYLTGREEPLKSHYWYSIKKNNRIDGVMPLHYTEGYYSFVHELQHALKLCEIDKTIEL